MKEAIICNIEGIGEMADRLEGSGRYGLPHKRFHLREIFVCADLQFLRRAPLLDFLRWSLRLIEAVQTRDHAIDLAFSDQSFRQQLIEKPPMRQLSHFHCILDDLSVFVVERETGIAFIDGRHCEVNLRAKPSIQLQLAPAKVMALFQRAEIEKAEIHRLLHLEDERRRDEDPGNVGLNRAHLPRAVRV